MALSTNTTGVTTSETTPIPEPILVTSRCIIRRFHISDIPAVAHHANNPNVARRLRPHFPSPYTIADAEDWYKHTCTWQKPLSYAICDHASNTFMGSIGIRPLGGDETRTAELGYWLGEEFWGRGIMTDAATSFARWVLENFEPDEVERLEASVHATNQTSQKVLTKAGFVYEGTRRRAGSKHGEVFDILTFGMIRQDLKEEK